MSTESRSNHFQADWLAKTLAGAVLGLALAFVLIGFFAWYGPGGIAATDKSQWNMWLLIPLWLTLFSIVYLFQTGRQAWLVLGSSTVLLYGLFFLLRSIG